MSRAAWLEDHDVFEGVGAHELNRRYDHVDGDDWDQDLRDVPQLEQKEMRNALPALFRAQSFLAVAPTRLDGHDGSHHQYDAGPVDLDALAQATWIIWWKATQSTNYTDPTFLRVWARRQLWTHRHAYHWLSSTTDPEQQADHFLQITGDMVPGDNGMLDAEEAGITVDWCLGFMEYVEARRKRPMSPYSGLFVAGGTIWNDDRIRESKYGLRPMHLAAYVDPARLAQIMAQRNAKPFDAWQYSSNGPVPGITGRADMNRIDNRPGYDRACGITANPQPTPVPLPPQGDDVNSLLIPVDDPILAQFYATTSNKVALSARWTGPGDNGGKNDKALAAHNAAGLVSQDVHVVDFLNIALDGPLPPGWTAEQFRNTDEIRDREAKAGTVDLVAREAFERQDGLIVKLNDSVGRLGQNQSGAALELERAAAALKGGG